MPTTTRFAFTLALTLTAACTSPADPAAAPDASPPRTALDPSGTYALRSTYALASPPAELAPLLAELSAATDGPDDPSAYVVDLVVAQLPEGTARTIASALAPYIASYVQTRVAMFAPTFVPGVRALAAGAQRIATRFATLEEVRLSADDRDATSVATSRMAHGRRTIRGVAFDDVELAFADVGLADTSGDIEVTIVRDEADRAGDAPDRVTIAGHTMRVPAIAWFRVGFDQAVIPTVVPGATDLATALRSLVDCPRLGLLFAEALGVGSPLLYTQACNLGLGAGASAIYERFPSAADGRLTELALEGVAHALDEDGDGALDGITDGAWKGRLGVTPVSSASFDGTAR